MVYDMLNSAQESLLDGEYRAAIIIYDELFEYICNGASVLL